MTANHDEGLILADHFTSMPVNPNIAVEPLTVEQIIAKHHAIGIVIRPLDTSPSAAERERQDQQRDSDDGPSHVDEGCFCASCDTPIAAADERCPACGADVREAS